MWGYTDDRRDDDEATGGYIIDIWNILDIPMLHVDMAHPMHNIATKHYE